MNPGRAAPQEHSKITQEYEDRLHELDRERQTLDEDKAQVGVRKLSLERPHPTSSHWPTLAPPLQVDRYKQLLVKQRDIMIALTLRLHERDDTVRNGSVPEMIAPECLELFMIAMLLVICPWRVSSAYAMEGSLCWVTSVMHAIHMHQPWGNLSVHARMLIHECCWVPCRSVGCKRSWTPTTSTSSSWRTGWTRRQHSYCRSRRSSLDTRTNKSLGAMRQDEIYSRTVGVGVREACRHAFN